MPLVFSNLGAVLGRLLTNCFRLPIPNYKTKIVVSDIIHYISPLW